MSDGRRKLQVLLGANLALCLTASAAWGQPPAKRYAKEGAIVGVSATLDTTLEGDYFDGDHFFRDSQEVFLVPQLNRRTNMRVMAGFRGGSGAFEASYEQTRHDGSFAGLTGFAMLHAINLDGRFFFATRHRVQPHVLVGLAIPWLTVEEGAATRTETGNVTYTGPGLNAGAGVTVYVHPRLGINLGYGYRAIWFLRGSGVLGKNNELKPAPRGAMRGVTVGTTVTF
jgi:opacity protein-like surface antigen